VIARLGALGADPIPVGRAEADLTNPEQARDLFRDVAAKVVVHCAAQGGGIGWMRDHPVESGRDNALINLNALEAAYQSGASLFIGASSTCAYPRTPTVPFKEEELWDGYPEPTNAAYAQSKRLMMELGKAYYDQHGFRTSFALLGNLYGPGDDVDKERAHVVAALILRCLEHPEELVVWGTGQATREHLYVEDAADGLLALAQYGKPDPINIGTGREVSVADLARAVVRATGFKGAIVFDESKPDGQPRKVMDCSRAHKLLDWRAKTPLDIGLAKTVQWYQEQLGC